MDWAYLNFGPKLILGINQSPKSNLKPKINFFLNGQGVFWSFYPMADLPLNEGHFGNSLEVEEVQNGL